MVAALAVFILVAGSIFGAYLAFTKIPDYLAGQQLEERLRELSGPKVQAESVLLPQKASSALPVVDSLVGRTDAGSWLARLIEQSGLRTSPGSVVLFSIASAAGLGLAALVFVRRFEAAIVAALLGLALPIAFLRYKRSVRMKKFEEMFPEALDLLSRAIRAGHAFQTSMGMVADELRPPVGEEFRKSFDQQNFGLPLKDALSQLAERVPLMDVRFFVTAVQIQRETGGNLAEILDSLAHVVRERFKILRQVRTHTAHGRFTGYVLLALPAALAVALSFISPDHIQTLFTTRMGQTMVTGAVVMQTIGFIWIRQIIRIEV
jgi:tight adherence protein B